MLHSQLARSDVTRGRTSLSAVRGSGWLRGRAGKMRMDNTGHHPKHLPSLAPLAPSFLRSAQLRSSL